MKNFKYKLNAWVVTAVVIIAVIFVNIIVSTLSAKVNLKIDLTSGKQFEITSETRNALKKLDKKIKVTIIGKEDEVSPTIREYVTRYKAMSSELSFEYLDVYKNQSFLYSYKQKGEELSMGDMVFELDNRYRVVSGAEIYQSSPSFEEDVANYSFDLESKMTNAVVTISGMTGETITYFLEGHAEQAGYAFPSAVKSQSDKTDTISIVNQDIPKDANLLISFAPGSDFSNEELEKIDKFLDNGGSFLVCYTAGVEKLDRLDKYLGEWGITPRQTVVIEKDSAKSSPQNPYAFLPDTHGHDITKNIESLKLPLIFNVSVDFAISNENAQRATVTAVATSSAKSIGKTDLTAQTVEFAEGDFKGPLNVAVVSEKQTPKKARLMAIGSASALELNESKANSEFSVGSIAWLAQNENNLKISPKIISDGKITKLTESGASFMYYGLVWVIPLIIIACGIFIWLKRRRL